MDTPCLISVDSLAVSATIRYVAGVGTEIVDQEEVRETDSAGVVVAVGAVGSRTVLTWQSSIRMSSVCAFSAGIVLKAKVIVATCAVVGITKTSFTDSCVAVITLEGSTVGELTTITSYTCSIVESKAIGTSSTCSCCGIAFLTSRAVCACSSSVDVEGVGGTVVASHS